MMARCAGTKPDGGQCTAIVNPQQRSYCYWHDPARAGERRRNASRGGKAKSSREIADLKKQLEDLADDVRAGRMERGDAVVINQVLNTRARLIELGRKVKEQDEILQRIEALERKANHKGGTTAWRQTY